MICGRRKCFEKGREMRIGGDWMSWWKKGKQNEWQHDGQNQKRLDGHLKLDLAGLIVLSLQNFVEQKEVFHKFHKKRYFPLYEKREREKKKILVV